MTCKESWRVDDLTIDVGGQTVLRDGDAIALPQLSFRFLLALIHAAPDVLSTDDLMERVWTGVFVNAETVKQRAKLLRDALGDDPKEPRYFSVRRGVGYQLLAPPVRLDADAAACAPTPARRWKILLASGVLGIAVLGGFTAVQLMPEQHLLAPATVRVAVLPFDNLSSDPADAFIARSIPEMVLNRLSSVRGLAVISRDSSMLSIAAQAAPAEAGAKLNAAYVVKGSVQRSAAMLRVTCFVIDTGSGARLWSEYFDWPIDRIYALQDRIADHVATSLGARVRGLGDLPSAPQPTRNTEAYLAYLKGTSLLGRYTVAETDAAAEQFERAVRLDPDFAQAMVALYDARMQGADLRKDDLAPFRARYKPLLDRALQLEPDAGPALFAEAMWSDRPVAERKTLFRRAAELDPSNSRGLTAYALFLDRFLDTRANPDVFARDVVGGSQEAKALIDRALTLDPLSPRARFWAIQRHWTRITPERIEQEQARELALDPQNYMLANRYAMRRWMIRGETAEAIEKMERVIASDPQQAVGPNAAFAFYLDADDPAAARAVAGTTPASRAASRILLSQYVGDWRGAGDAAFGPGGHMFNSIQTWNWPQAVRDYALRTGDYDAAVQAIAARFGFDLKRLRTTTPAQVNAAPALAHLLLAKGDRAGGTALLAQTVQWVDDHPNFGLAVHMRQRATAMMLLGNPDAALSNLRVSVETGHDIRHWWYVVDRDPVWAPVRSDPRFKAIAELFRKAAAMQHAKLEALRREGKVPVRTTLARS